jgi:DNA polymerase (family 10)
MTNDTICEVLENIARLLEIKGENPFKIRAYVNGARTIETTSADLKQLAAEGRLGELDGIGQALAEKIKTLIETGELPFYNHLREEFPPDILTLFDLQGLGAKKIKVLWDKLQISSLSALERACRDGRVAALEGFGEKSAAKILDAISHRKQNVGKFILGEVTSLASTLLDDLRSHPDVTLADVAGSFRRGKEVVHDLDLLASSRSPAAVIEAFTSHPLVDSVIANGPTKASVRLKNGLQCDLRVVASAEFPFALNYFTGSKEHNVRMRSRALDRGWSLNEYRFSTTQPDAATPPQIDQESDIYRALGLDYIAPELRENLGEFAAAENGMLPELIAWHNLRGTFHVHTTGGLRFLPWRKRHGTLAFSIWASAIIAEAPCRQMASPLTDWQNNAEKLLCLTPRLRISTSSLESSVTSSRTARSTIRTMSLRPSTSLLPQCMPRSHFPKRR